jgi:hypothetical protein
MTLTNTQVNWSTRWLGGFCAVAAIGGLPVRGADDAAHAPLARALTLPPVTIWLDAEHETVRSAWEDALGGAPVVLVRSVERARELLLLAAGVKPGEFVGVPANGDRDLVESVKHFGARPAFFDLDTALAPAADARQHGVRFRWAQPFGGMGAIGDATWVDCADTLPDVDWRGQRPQATLFGLHLAADERNAGALLVLGDVAFARTVHSFLCADDLPDPSRALTQLRRLLDDGATSGLARQQQAVLTETRRGLADAAGLELLPACEHGALAQHVAVRIPDESDPATFYAYVKAERTPVRWLTTERPLHYAAVREPGRSAATAAELARWLLVPVGPEYTDEEIKHAVLGVVKAAEYLGVRWRTNPGHAAEYAAMLDELYGPEHDAYRPVFPVETLVR